LTTAWHVTSNILLFTVACVMLGLLPVSEWGILHYDATVTVVQQWLLDGMRMWAARCITVK
jgi:hypothetical protein